MVPSQVTCGRLIDVIETRASLIDRQATHNDMADQTDQPMSDTRRNGCHRNAHIRLSADEIWRPLIGCSHHPGNHPSKHLDTLLYTFLSSLFGGVHPGKTGQTPRKDPRRQIFRTAAPSCTPCIATVARPRCACSGRRGRRP